MLTSGTAVGLYIDPRQIHVAELRRRFGQIRLTRYARLEWMPPPGTTHTPSLHQAIRSAFDQAGLHPRNVQVALHEKEVISRSFEMALLPRRDWAGAVRFESHKYVPFDTKDLYYDFHVFADKKTKRMRVEFLAVKKDYIDRLITAFSELDLKPRAIEAASFGLMRAHYLERPAAKDETSALLYLDVTGQVVLAVTKDQSLLLSRTSVLAEGASEKGTASEPRYDPLAAEVRLSLNYFAKNFRHEKIGRMVFYGNPETGTRGWEERLQRDFNIPCERPGLAPLLGCPSEVLTPGMVVAVGTALRDIAALKGPRINLVPKGGRKSDKDSLSLPPEEEKRLLRKWAIGEGIAVGALLLLFHSGMGRFLASKDEAVRQVRQTPATTVSIAKTAPYEQVTAKESELTKELSFLSKLVDQRDSLTGKMNELARLTPNEVRLFRLDYQVPEAGAADTAAGLRAEGVIRAKEPGSQVNVANRFVTLLKESPEFSKGLKDLKVVSVRSPEGRSVEMNFIIESKRAG